MCCRRVALDVLQHTLELDLRFHLHRKTGEVTRIMDRGTNALQSILSTVLFNIGEPVQLQYTCVLVGTALQSRAVQSPADKPHSSAPGLSTTLHAAGSALR